MKNNSPDPPGEDSSNDEDITSNDSFKYNKGDTFDKFFPFSSWFEGEISCVTPNSE